MSSFACFFVQCRLNASRGSGVLAFPAMLSTERVELLPEVCGLVIFGLRVQDVLDWPVERNLDICELWSGVGAVAGAARAHNLASR